MDDSRVSSSARLTRRSVLTRVGIGGAGMMLALPGSGAAQDATPTTGTVAPVVDEWAAAWLAHDPDRIAATYSEAASMVDVPSATTLEGREAIHAYLTQYFAALEDLSSEIITLFATEEWAAAEWVFSGRYTGQYPGFPPGEGQSVTVYGAEILGLAGGQIQQDHRYYDTYGILVQLGLVPPPASAATPVT